MVFLARFAGTLTRPVVEEASRDARDRGRVPVEGVSEVDRPTADPLGELSDRLEDDGSETGISEEVARGGRKRSERLVKRLVKK